MLRGEIKINDNVIVTWQIENVRQIDKRVFEYEYYLKEITAAGTRQHAAGTLYHQRSRGAIALVREMFDDAQFKNFSYDFE